MLQTTLNRNLDFIYYNFFLNNQSDTESINAVIIQENKEPIIDEQSNYQMGLIKFSLPLSSVPIFIYLDNGLSADDPNYLSDYWLGFSLGAGNTNVKEVNLKLTPYNELPNSDIRSRFIYYYSQMLSIVNKAFEEAWGQVIADAAYTPILNATGNNNASYYPYFMNQDENQFFTLVLPCGSIANPADYISACPFSTDKTTTGINILMSSTLYRFFSGFPLQKYYNFTTIGQNLTRQMMIKVNQENVVAKQLNVGTLAVAPNDTMQRRFVVEVKQDFPCNYLWQDIKRIIFTTTTMPINYESFAVSTQGLPYKQLIISDYDIPIDRYPNQKDLLQYNTDVPRWINFTGVGPLKMVDVKVYFQDNRLNIYELMLQPHEDFLMKLQFKRRKERTQLENVKSK